MLVPRAIIRGIFRRKLLGGFSQFALALTFKTADTDGYWVSGTKYATVNLVPGYTYTRSGAKGEINALTSTDRIDDFGTNVPAVVPGVGYWSRGALTNLILQSQEFTTAVWAKSGATASANTFLAPDGTITADSLVSVGVGSGECSAMQAVTVAASSLHTTSVFIPAGGDAAFAYFQINTDGGNASFITINRATGAVGANTPLVGTLVLTGYSIAVGTGWRFIVTYTSAATTTVNCYVGLCSAANNRTAATGVTLPVWQMQTLQGNLPDGGPIIVTGAATAATGADALTTTTNPILADQDFIWWAVVNVLPSSTTAVYVTMGGAGNLNLQRIATGEFRYTVGGANITAATPITSGRGVIMGRRRGGKDTIAYKIGSTVTVMAEGLVTVLGATTSTLHIGNYNAAGLEAGAPIEGIFVRTGAFDDAAITAILAAA